MQGHTEFELAVPLICQMPMIHFQYDKPGATLRATEVKPKLDRFLRKKFHNTSEIPATWYFEGNGAKQVAFCYKMHFEMLGNQTYREPYSIFYGNRGAENFKMLRNGDCLMRILCLEPTLMAFIKTHLTEFFAVTNFGTMQGKGFGSYLPRDITDEEKRKIPGWLKAETGSTVCFQMGPYTDGLKPFKGKDGKKYKKACQATEFMMDDIETLIGVIKSGQNIIHYKRSYLFDYFHQKDVPVGSEKAFLKKQGIAPAVVKSVNRDKIEDSDYSTYRYVRALLGIRSILDFIQALDEQDRPVKSYNPKKDRKEATKEYIEVKDLEGKIERFPSPLFFKVVGDIVYFTAKRLDNRIFGKTFRFTNITAPNEDGSPKTVTLKAPEKHEFDLDDFLTWFVSRYNEVPKQMRYRTNKDIVPIQDGREGEQ